MAAKIIAVVCVQFALFNMLDAQCLNRLPGMFPGCGNILPVPEIPNPVLLPNFPEPIVNIPYGMETIVTSPVVSSMYPVPQTATIIQDSSVANNLANALQLLVVSNLLSNTLPTAGEIIVPSYGPSLDYGLISPVVNPCNYGPYNYIY